MPQPRRIVIAVLAVTQIALGVFALRATMVHAAAYTLPWQWWSEIVVFSAIVLSGLGLLRQRRWARHTTALLIYLAFFVVMVAISLAFETRATHWWYWLLPAALPILGWCLYELRRSTVMWR